MRKQLLPILGVSFPSCRFCEYWQYEDNNSIFASDVQRSALDAQECEIMPCSGRMKQTSTSPSYVCSEFKPDPGTICMAVDRAYNIGNAQHNRSALRPNDAD